MLGCPDIDADVLPAIVRILVQGIRLLELLIFRRWGAILTMGRTFARDCGSSQRPLHLIIEALYVTTMEMLKMQTKHLTTGLPPGYINIHGMRSLSDNVSPPNSDSI